MIAPLIACAAAAQQSVSTGRDVLIPQQGHSLFGTFQGATDEAVTFLTDGGAAATISWKRIKEIQIHCVTIVRTKRRLLAIRSAKPVTLNSLTIQQTGGTLSISSPGRNLTVSVKNLESISVPATSPPVAWAISISPKASLSSGTQIQQTLGAQVRAQLEQNPGKVNWHHRVTRIILDANNSLTEQVGKASVRAHKYEGSFDHAVYLWSGLHANILAEGYHNTSLNLYLQQSYGGGLGKCVIKNERHTLELREDFLYIAEHFYGLIPSVSFVGTRLAENYTIKLVDLNGGPLDLIEGTSYTPAFNQLRAWQTRGTATLSIPISKTLRTKIDFGDDYFENAPNGRKNYSSTSIAIDYTFSRPK